MRNYGQEYATYSTITYPLASASSGSLLVKASAGQFCGIMVTGAGNTPTLVVSNNSTGTTVGGTDILSSFTPVAGTLYKFSTPVNFDSGLFIVSTGSVGLTVAYI